MSTITRKRVLFVSGGGSGLPGNKLGPSQVSVPAGAHVHRLACTHPRESESEHMCSDLARDEDTFAGCFLQPAHRSLCTTLRTSRFLVVIAWSVCTCVCTRADSDVLKLSPQPRSRVVVVKYDRKPLSNKTLFAFTEPFGVLREHLVLKNKVRNQVS